MALYEVFIPAKPGTDDMSITVRVEASSWLLALRSGMKQIGEQGDALSSIMVENRPDGTVIVKDPGSRRQFRINEITGEDADKLSEESAKREEEDRKEQERLEEEKKKLAADRERLEKELAEKRKQEEENRDKARHEHEEAKKRAAEEEKKQAAEAEKKRATMQALQAEKERQEKEKELKKLREQEEKLAREAERKAEGKSKEVSVTKSKATKQDITEDDKPATVDWDVNDVLADLYFDTEEFYDMDEKDVLEKGMELAQEHIPAEAASVILSDLNKPTSPLYFAAATGDAKDKLMAIQIPKGKGIVGFCVSVGVPLVVSDVQSNPNFYGAVDDKSKFQTKSLLCVPIIAHERTLGALELVNKKGTNKWAVEEMNVALFIANKIGEKIIIGHEREKL